MNLEDLKNTVANLTVPSLPFTGRGTLTQVALRRQVGDPESAEW